MRQKNNRFTTPYGSDTVSKLERVRKYDSYVKDKDVDMTAFRRKPYYMTVVQRNKT